MFGEWVTVYDESEGWGWVQLERDRYVGYLPAFALGPRTEPTHRVAALRAHAYPGPSIKLAPHMALSLGARTAIVRQAGDFAITADGLCLWARHLTEVGPPEVDFVAVAEQFLARALSLGRPDVRRDRLLGARQAGLTAAGVAAPRDSDQQEAGLGEPVALAATLTRGDLVFWKGHVGVMRDAATLLHANGWHMAVVSEPLAAARARIAASGGGNVTSVKRLGQADTPLSP